MKAFFIFKDGKVVGSQIGYTTEKGAINSLVGSKEWHEQLSKYNKGNGNINESDLNEFYEFNPNINAYLFNRTKWSKKIWQQFVKENFEIIEKEFNIVFVE